MRLFIGAIAPALLVLACAPADAQGLTTPDGTCLLFCNSSAAAPQPTASPDAQASPLPLHVAHHRSTGHKRVLAWRAHAHAKPALRTAHTERPSVALASANPHTAAPPPMPPEPVVASAPPPAPPESVTPAPAVALVSASAQAPATSDASEESRRLLELAYAEHAEKAHPAAPPPEPVATAVPTPPAPPTPVAAWRASFIEMTANGIVLPRWPSTFPGRAGVWLALLAAFAALALGGAKARGRYYRHETQS